MTDSPLFTHEELEELLGAIETHRNHLARLYATPGFASADWCARDRKLKEIRDKIIGMKS